eukprot:TRINITY_DN16608_c0_g1_i1.p1 TRINITY_DN16608_c0_g1~~TRINITY_DN16608_c0_g1_i1.p1  ORF type:complete len:677 (+),score=53.25 TRINITY_DN16608_c0_g1_i1:208-2238(+)
MDAPLLNRRVAFQTDEDESDVEQQRIQENTNFRRGLLTRNFRSSMLQRKAFRENRNMIGRHPEQALLTMDPYGRVSLTVTGSRNLCCTSDTHVELRLNDVPYGDVSQPKASSSAPAWDFTTDLEIWSPNSIVQIRVVDKICGMIGFVEFRLADLDPCEELVGWLELRRPSKLVGFADGRLRAHMLARDAEDIENSLRLPPPPRRIPRWQQCIQKVFSLDGDDADWEPDSYVSSVHASTSSERIEPPEIHIRVRLDADPADEWYAFEFPKPDQTYEMGPVEARSLDLRGLHADLVEIKRFVWDDSIRKVVSICSYISTWQSPALCFALLVWWWLICFLPICLASGAPLCVSFFVFLLRRQAWREALLVYEGRVAISNHGFEQVAALHNTNHMALFVRRVANSIGGQIVDPIELHKFASKLFSDGAPVMTLHNLQAQLKKKPWVDWDKEFVKCPQCSFAAAQTFSYEEEGSWICHGIPNTDRRARGHGQCARSCRSRASSARLAIGRFQCKGCKSINICEDCFTTLKSPQTAPLWTRIPARFVPLGVERCMLHFAVLVHLLRLRIDAFRESAFLALLRSGPGDDHAFFVYKFCLACSVCLALVYWFVSACLYRPLKIEWYWVIKCFWLCVGSMLVLFYLPMAVRLRTRIRATWDYRFYKQRRERGGPATNWAFYSPGV